VQVIRVTKFNDDGSIAFEGNLGPNEAKYVIEQGLNIVLQAGAEAIEGMMEDDDEEEVLVMQGPDTVQ
jgi:hypothetical protein